MDLVEIWIRDKKMFTSQMSSNFCAEKIKNKFMLQFLSYRSQFQKFKKGFGPRILYLDLPIKIATDFDKIYVSRKLGPGVFERRKNRQRCDPFFYVVFFICRESIFRN